MNLKVGIIGFGSIGKRHANNLVKLGVTQIFLLRSKNSKAISDFEETTSSKVFFERNYDLLIISNPTSLHYKYLKIAIKKCLNVFVEKPVVSNYYQFKMIEKMIKNYNNFSFVGYNMRFHPCIIFLKNFLLDNNITKIYSVRSYVGQFLPDWRPHQDYRNSYSSKLKLGGGVGFDLIHEVDLMAYFFGYPQNNFSFLSEKLSNLEIETNDILEILYKSKKNIFVSIHMDYLTKNYCRKIEILTENNGILEIDLHSNKVTSIISSLDKKLLFEDKVFKRNDMYYQMMSNVVESIKSKTKSSLLPDIQEGLKSVEIILKTI